jgi:arylsulfatase A-like enzyme
MQDKLFTTSAWFLLLVVFSACSPNQNPSPPNIVIFYADDLGWMDLGIQGSGFYETPNIDRIGREGMRFTQAYANCANCAPSRASLMTGLYTPRHGIYTVANPDRGKAENRRLIPASNRTVLDTSLLTLPQYLRQQGYATCMAGKWHLSENPADYGFETNFGGTHRGAPKSYFSPYQNPYLPDGPTGEHLPDRLSEEVVNWLEQQEDRFFLYFPFYSVHTPIQAREDLTAKYLQKTPSEHHNHPQYAAMIEAMDQAVGKVLALLDEKGLADNTLVLFSSDNGSYGPVTLSRPLRGSKGMFYEGGIRIPLLARWPGQIEAGTINESPVIGSDWFPTLAEIAGGAKPQPQFDGQSFLPAIKGQALPERSLFWHFPAYLQMYKKDRAFEDSHDKPWFRSTPVSVIRKGDWKLMEFFENGDIELYNLAQDIGERENLVLSHPEERDALYRELKAWQEEVGAAIPTERNPEYKAPN